VANESQPLNPATMTIDRYNELLNGALAHPLWPMRLSRLQIALWFVLERTGEAGTQALEDHCRVRDEQDRQHDGNDL
jgi:hypothetical protein